MQVILVLALIFALLVAVFAVQNAALVDVHFLAWRFSGISLALVILGSVAGGAVLAFLLGLGKQVRLGRQLRDCRQAVAQLQGELERLRKAEALETGDTAPLPPVAGKTGRDD